MILCDTGPVVALIDQDDTFHARCVAALDTLPAEPLLTTWPCLVEAMYLLWRAGGFPAQEELWGYLADELVVLHTSAIRLQQVILDPTQDLQRMVALVSQPNIEAQITPSASPLVAGPAASVSPQPVFTNEVERKIPQVTYDIIGWHESLPGSAYLL